jgi:hypothetical protein
LIIYDKKNDYTDEVKSMFRPWKAAAKGTDDRDQMTEGGWEMTDDRKQMTENRWQRADERWQMTEGGKQTGPCHFKR